MNRDRIIVTPVDTVVQVEDNGSICPDVFTRRIWEARLDERTGELDEYSREIRGYGATQEAAIANLYQKAY